ncbi:ABC transporter permease [Actinomadura algeriensis]|uniref:D-xylose transport system permease protein n=1 Tax=Actinomadura algeriensis TaxID=1679523 RepID=A0ABR9JNA8_9ACTN|nr:ABC transporter permease [Actinomadura algeriensis]MBE1532030.1 D-xylose transport system permease protein [Actinomadura algeriensis]
MSTETTSGRPRLPAALRLGNAGVVYALVLLVAVLTFAAQAQGRVFYLGPTNVANILDQTTLIGLMAITTTIVLISGNFDLSVGAVAALGAAVCLSLADDIGFWPALLAALLVGALIGLFNGVVVQYFGINAFIVTLGTMTAIRGVVLIVTDGRTVTAPEGAVRDGLRAIDGGSWITPNLYLLAGLVVLAVGVWRAVRSRQWRPPRILVPLVAGVVLVAASPVAIFTIRITQRTLYLLLLAIVAAWVLRYTTIGRRLYASGGNPEAARLSGIAVDRYKVVAFVLNGTVAAFVGVLYAARLGSINPSALSGFELTALAAAILGGTSLFGGLGSVGKSLVGALILITLRNGFNILNLGANWQGLVEGVVLIVAAGVYTISLRRGQTRRIREAESPAPPGDGPESPPPPEKPAVSAGAADRKES